jgi:hypothetical protein
LNFLCAIRFPTKEANARKEAEMSERKAYVIVEVGVTDAAKYGDYTKHSIPAVAAFGGLDVDSTRACSTRSGR